MATSASTLDYLMSFYHHSSAVPTPTSSSSVEAEPLGDINSDNTTTTIAHHHQHSNPNNNTPPNHNNHHSNIIMDAKNRKNLADVKYLHPFSTSPSHNGHRHSAGPEGACLYQDHKGTESSCLRQKRGYELPKTIG